MVKGDGVGLPDGQLVEEGDDVLGGDVGEEDVVRDVEVVAEGLAEDGADGGQDEAVGVDGEAIGAVEVDVVEEGGVEVGGEEAASVVGGVEGHGDGLHCVNGGSFVFAFLLRVEVYQSSRRPGLPQENWGKCQKDGFEKRGKRDTYDCQQFDLIQLSTEKLNLSYNKVRFLFCQEDFKRYVHAVKLNIYFFDNF